MDLIGAFEEYLEDKDRSAYTIKGYRRNLETFFDWLQEQTGQEIPPGEVTTFDVKAHRKYLEEEGRKPATINRSLSALRVFFDWMVSKGQIASSPASNVKQIRVKKRGPKSLSKQDLYLLQRTAAARRQVAEAKANGEITSAVRVACRDEALLAMFLYTGIRVGELVRLRVTDVEIGERSGRVAILGKGKKYREVPLNAEVRQSLRAWQEVRPKDDGDDHFFLGRQGAMTERAVQLRIAEIGDQARVEVTPHMLRHTFATRLLREAKVDLVATSHLMGHENIATTAVYTQPTEEDLAEAVERL
jgi:site-specific recombinase XerC